MTDAPLHLWRFDTREGSVRIGLTVADELADDRLGELRGCAIVAESMNEFLQLASNAIHTAGGMISDIDRVSWTIPPLRGQLRRAAKIRSVVEVSAVAQPKSRNAHCT